MDFNAFAFWLLCGLLGIGVAILGTFLKGILDEMKTLNAQLIAVVTNQEWHYREILYLKEEVAKLKELINARD
jgi:hypothetical protein